jgi:hypothetical protein
MYGKYPKAWHFRKGELKKADNAEKFWKGAFEFPQLSNTADIHKEMIKIFDSATKKVPELVAMGWSLIARMTYSF